MKISELEFTSAKFDQLLNDAQIAKLLNLSQAWVRRQRYLRRKGDDHFLTIDPVLIGSVPRYRAADINDWLENL